MSKPMAAMSGSRASASRKVALRDGSGVHDRGNISYHAPHRARTGSTVTRSTRSKVVDRVRSARASISARSSGSRAAAIRSLCGRSLRRRSVSSAPSCSSLETSWPAAAFASRSLSQVPKRSTQPSTVYSYSPSSLTRNEAPQLSLSSGVRGISVHAAGSAATGRPAGTRLYFRTPASRSCPSANMSTVTDTSSPTVRLIGKRPPSICGRRRSTTTRHRPAPRAWASVAAVIDTCVRAMSRQAGRNDRLAEAVRRTPAWRRPEHKGGQRAPLQRVRFASVVRPFLDGRRNGVERAHPGRSRADRREGERHLVRVRVEQDQHRIAPHLAPPLVNLVERVADHQYSERSRERRVPRLVGHLASRRIEPVDVLGLGAANSAAVKILAALEHRLRPSEAQESPRERQELLLFQ